MMRQISYFIILLIFISFGINDMVNASLHFDYNFIFADYIYTSIIGILFSLFSIMILKINRRITSVYGKFILKNSLLSLKFNVYIIQVLIFLVYKFALTFFFEFYYSLPLMKETSYFLSSVLIALLFGIVIDLFLNGITVFRKKK